VEHVIEATREADAVKRLRDAIGSGKKGIAGLVPVLQALNEKRVASLLVSAGFTETGWQCGCGGLFALGPKCPIDGQTMVHLDDVIGDAIDAALLEGATIEICTGSADLDVLGSIGALLRY
jgi:peptide subunit release factor 1 (eRF1)